MIKINLILLITAVVTTVVEMEAVFVALNFLKRSL